MKQQKTRSMKILSCFLLLVLFAAMALTAVGCNGKNDGGEDAASTTTVATTVIDPANIRGEGSVEFTFTVVTASGETKVFLVKTDKEIVGEALVDAGLISGEEGPYGLYVKTVDGETVDYATHGKYWAFYVDGSYGLTGVDVTKIEAGKEYSFRAEKG